MSEPDSIIDIVSYDLPGLGVTEEVGGYWCYAATEQAIRIMMLSDARQQEQIAHDFFMAFAAIGMEGAGDTATITRYATAVQEAAGQGGDTSYDAVLPYLETHSDTRALLGRTWGDLQIAGALNCQYASDLDWDAVTATIHANGLVVAGTPMHYTVIYGYRMDTATPSWERSWYLLWDPANGAGRPVPVAQFEASIVIHVTP